MSSGSVFGLLTKSCSACVEQEQFRILVQDFVAAVQIVFVCLFANSSTGVDQDELGIGGVSFGWSSDFRINIYFYM